MEKSLIYAIKYKSKRKNRGHVFVVWVWECVEGARGSGCGVHAVGINTSVTLRGGAGVRRGDRKEACR